MLFSVRLLLSSYIHNNNISSVQKCTKVGISNPQPLNYIIIQSKLLSQMQGKQKKNPTKQTGGCFSWMDAYFWSGIFPSTKIHFQCHHTGFLSGRSWAVTVEEEREGAREREGSNAFTSNTPTHFHTYAACNIRSSATPCVDLFAKGSECQDAFFQLAAGSVSSSTNR